VSGAPARQWCGAPAAAAAGAAAARPTTPCSNHTHTHTPVCHAHGRRAVVLQQRQLVAMRGRQAWPPGAAATRERAAQRDACAMRASMSTSCSAQAGTAAGRMHVSATSCSRR
jgi:hypothetical protein